MRLSLFRSPASRFCVLLLWCARSMAGQAAAVPDQYAAESIVLVKSESVVSMAADGTGWRERTVAARVQSDAAVRQLGVLSIPFAGSSERVEIQYARVRRPDGTVIETPVADAMEMPDPVTREAPFYSDLKQKQLPIRNLRVGDIFEWKAKIVRTKAEAPGEFWGLESRIEDAVTLSDVFELRVPETKKVTVWSPAWKPVETTAGGERIYRWTSAQLKPTAGKEAEAAAEAKKKLVWTPEQELDNDEGKLPAIAWTTFPSWEAVGAWYRGLEGDRMDPGPEVKAKVAEVTAGKTTEEEKVRAVYGYVATQIRYIGVAFGVGRYQPHRAAEVLENQYGDCKDKHTLLAAMLGALGLKADAVLIGAGIRFNPDVPSPAAFNHLITQVAVGGQTVWLDATAEVAPYRLLVPTIRDRSALVIPESGTARVEKTPKELPFQPYQKLEAVGTLDKDGISNSKMTLTLRGDVEVFVRTVLRQIPPAQYDQLVQKISEGMSFAGTTSHAEISRAEDTAQPLTIHYDYHREKVGDWDNLRTLAQLAPVSLPIADEKDPPVRSISLGGAHTEISTSAMKLPDGWSAELPEAVHAHSKYVNWDQTYRLENGTLYADRRVEVLVDKVPQADWKAYKKWTDITTPGNELYVQLVKPMCAGCGKVKGGGTKIAAPASNASAADLVQTAYEAIQRNDVDTAGPLLDQARKLNEKQPFLWSTYGYKAYRRGKWAEAAEDYEKELALHPERYGTYRDLGSAYMFEHKPEDAIAAARRWVAAQPEDPQAVVFLMGLMVSQKNYAGAVDAGDKALMALPEEKRKDEGLQFNLAMAEIKGGRKEQGVTRLTEVLRTTENAGMLNSAAYELTLQGEELGLAETSARKSLAILDAETKTWTLDEKLTTLKNTSQLVAATWDTLGWVLYREGKTEEAESYVRSAWINSQHAEVGEHLGDILAARGERAEAIKTYKLVLHSGENVTLREKLKTLEKDGPKVEVDGEKGLQAMRTFPLGPAGGRNGTAEYKMLLSANGVDKVMVTGEKDLPGGLALLKKVQFANYIPKGSDARLVRAGILNCHSGVCELVLEP